MQREISSCVFHNDMSLLLLPLLPTYREGEKHFLLPSIHPPHTPHLPFIYDLNLCLNILLLHTPLTLRTTLLPNNCKPT
jgi:hypothetical protein